MVKNLNVPTRSYKPADLKLSLRVFAPKGQPQISPGQRPGATKSNAPQALKGRHNGMELFRPFRAHVSTFEPIPGAMPWADLFGPFRTKSEERKSWLHLRQ